MGNYAKANLINNINWGETSIKQIDKLIEHIILWE